ncbi:MULTISPECIES: DedA family protein [unclassified Bacillus (in: firmicutes)]|uniref:DedA family protein n=1 Tax=unclassified Bacillus (in: firmicutes) TaxID=185979 RepID=UPI00211D1860|nr:MULTISPECIES: DedA family protein [unclassified Bacillus (in: firmicutes)]
MLLTNIIHQILDFFASLGYLGVALGLMIEVIPSEIVLAYAGYLVAGGHINFVGAVVAGVIGGTIAQLFLYWLGYFGGRPIIEKYGKYILINKHHLDLAEKWFSKYGVGVVFTARFIPIVRHAISIPAGLAKMPIGKFSLYTVIAIIPWSILFVLIGEKLGKNWETAKEVLTPYTPMIAVIAAALLVVYFLIKKLVSKNRNLK